MSIGAPLPTLTEFPSAGEISDDAWDAFVAALPAATSPSSDDRIVGDDDGVASEFTVEQIAEVVADIDRLTDEDVADLDPAAALDVGDSLIVVQAAGLGLGTIATFDARWARLSGFTMAGAVTMSGQNIVTDTTTGTKIGTGTTQKLGFFNATPVVQAASTADLRTVLVNLGFLASGGATPLNLNGGALTAVSGTFSGGAGGTTVTVSGTTAPKILGVENGTNRASLIFTNVITLPTVTIRDEANSRDILQIIGGASGGSLSVIDGASISVGSTTGTKIGGATTQKLGFFNATPVVQPSSTGTSSGFTAGAGTNVTHLSTFTGGSGTKAYTIGDVVLHLKTLGFLAAS